MIVKVIAKKPTSRCKIKYAAYLLKSPLFLKWSVAPHMRGTLSSLRQRHPPTLVAPGSTWPFLHPCSYARYATMQCLFVCRFLAAFSACKGLLL